jgi:hypothetical protein
MLFVVEVPALSVVVIEAAFVDKTVLGVSVQLFESRVRPSAHDAL